tara:strand:+ start:270 stop:1526 length:1257 start_codon:yes stop_codon:yes gene_type:complete
MAIIYTFPLKSVANSSDLVIISDSEDGLKTKTTSIASIGTAINVVDSLNALKGDVTLSAGNNITLGTSGNIITINNDGIGSGTVNKITKWSASGNDIENSIITEDPGGPGITIAGNVLVASGSYISTPSILDGAGEFGSANQVLSKSADNSFIEWATTGGGDTYTLQAGTKSGTSVPLKLDAATGTDSTVNLKEGANITLLQNSATEIEIIAAGGGTVTSLTTNKTSGKATLTSGVLNIPSILIDGFETLPFTTANGYINTKGTYIFQMIAPSNCTPEYFKFYSLLGQAAGGTTAVAIYKGALGGVGSLNKIGEITGSYAADQISGSTLTLAESPSILAGDNIVVCLSFDSNISLLGVIPITGVDIVLTNASPVSNESLALFDSTTLTASQFPGTISGLLTLLSENTTTTSRPFLLIY